ncbi:MAG: hypothetical protein OXE43_02720 [Chloroflexi bacterium]|nr:hypothetical protein [Chloroflexota bacterium]
MIRAPHTRLIAFVVGLAALALWLGGGSSAAAADAACQVRAEATYDATAAAASTGPAARAPLSTPLSIEVACDVPTEIDLRLPGGGSSGYMVEGEAPLIVTGERAYLCHGQDAMVEVAASELDWVESVPISGINGIPQCDVMLRAGSTWLQWTGPRLEVREAFAGRALGWVQWERGADGTVPGLSVWSFGEDALLPVQGWGDGVAPLLQGLTHFSPGGTYLVVSNVERPWTFPRPPSVQSVFEDAQIVSFYGFPGVRAMGVLGHGTPAEVANAVADWAERYDRLNGPREVIPAYHLITGVAQAYPTRDGTWLSRLSHDVIAEYVEAAREREMILFLDVQIGWSDPLYEVQLLEEFLREPFVHMALDPEFATEHLGVRPGLAIGGIGADHVNEVQHYLATLVEEEGIPPKILMVHQFAARMLRDRDAVDDVEGVEISIDMDGFGTMALKLRHYDWYALTEPSERPALKLFFNQDTPVMTPEQVQAIDDVPDLIMYQ